ncbi:MAG: glycoside hydrolase family 2 protein [Armatimonadota bacterium]
MNLHEGWQVGWSEYGGGVASPAPDIATLPAEVPGDAHLDLMRAGVLPELYEGMNLDQAQWMEHKDWWYRCEFALPAGVDSRHALLVFHGLDTFATVWLNGRLIGQAANMFIQHSFPVGDALRSEGPNELVVRLASPLHSAPVDPDHAPLAWSPERLFCRKAQMSFGWDIAPRLVTTGIWRPVEVVFPDVARITDVQVTPLAFTDHDVRVRITVEVEGTADTISKAQLSGQIGVTPWKMEIALQPGVATALAEITLPDAPLWWPIGYGAPALLPVETRLEMGGRILDTHEFRTGLRHIELVTDPQPSGAQSFTFRVNGRDVFITGFNWTPVDAIFARITPEKLTRTLEALAGVGCNMLRVWGGGFYEPQHFYRECDRLGIMVWQDFMMSCGWYPQTEAFAAKLAVEAQQVARDLRGHPCLALWCGDNEVDAFYPELAAGNRLTRGIFADTCREIDPQTPYIPSSPWRPSGEGPVWISSKEGDSHCWGHGKDYRDPFFMNVRPRFMSEFGHLSLPSLELIRRYFPPGTEWPLTNAMWKYHGADVSRVKWFRDAGHILRALEACGKPLPRTLEDAVPLTQEHHAEAVCAWIEQYCADPEFSGFLLWNVADCWPQQSDAVIDYLGNPKAVFARLGELFPRMRVEHTTVTHQQQ